ncbi:hypothetical protein [Azospirillum rugosum]|uniref:Uncharacterized protein n=1 Tax=Azospirillum rugosum TaxID=416170 RepID=A0ABS4SUX5_9PROT|nr:hypothetical protein [Azospirillum rugosum]MBP2296370.1 hypothetical protein [Azospirillum rugosum]MDQ0529891.1 hypothetical protein [Azospirillum rugosum]
MDPDDWSNLKLVCAWAIGGLTVSAVAVAALLTVPKPPGGVIVERAIHNMDQETCERLLRRFAEQPLTGSSISGLGMAGSRVLWLWAEESTPGVYTGAPWTAQIAGMPSAGGTTASPRPYAFDPAAQAIPPEACSFPSNSLYIVAVEGAAGEKHASERTKSP